MTENIKAFNDDSEKMYDFYNMTKEQFLDSYSYLTEEEYDATFENVIHSDEFKSLFGDWEKALRLEKLKSEKALETDGRVILNNDDVTETIDSLIENDDRKSIQSLEKEIGKTIVGQYLNLDTGLSFNVSNRNVTEISNHHYLWKEHIKSISLIPQISERAIYIGEEWNEQKERNPNIIKYKYFATGIKIDNEDYTCKVVIGVDANKNCYYDQSLSTIEKGRLVDLIMSQEEDSNLSPLITQREATSPYEYYDKRLFNICQVPQLRYLDENLQPTLEAVQAVYKGTLYVEKSGQEYVMHDVDEMKITSSEDYLLLSGEKITNIPEEELIISFTSSLNAANEYANDVEKKSLSELYQKMFEKGVDIYKGQKFYDAATIFDKKLRDIEKNHWNPEKKEYEKDIIHNEKLTENKESSEMSNIANSEKPIIYGKTILPAFSMIIDGHLTECDEFIVQDYNRNSKTYLLQKGDEKIEIPKESLESILKPDSLKKETEIIKQGSGRGIVFQNQENNIKGTLIPEFTLLTSEGLKNYKDCVVTTYDKEHKVYILENENSSVVIPEDKFNEIISPERFKIATRFNEDTKPYDKMLKSQYEDYFKERSNTAGNFIHNLEVKCRKEAANPCDALKVAKAIIDKMSKAEQVKLQRTLNLIKKEDETLNTFMIGVYHRAVSSLPVNEEFMKKNYPSNVIARPFYDVIYENGQKISEDRDLIKNGKDYNLRIGDSIRDVVLNADNAIGKGKTSIKIDELKLISSSKEGNCLTLVDKNNSYYTLPRDTILQNYKHQQEKAIKREEKDLSRRQSNQLNYSYI